MKDAWKVKLGGEEALIERRDGKLYCQAYDIENERMALSLNGGYGEGIGVLLAALYEFNGDNVPLVDLLKDFSSDMEILGRSNVFGFTQGAYRLRPYSPVTYTYLAFSPNKVRRHGAACHGKLSFKTWQRLLADPEENVVIEALARAPGPKASIIKFLHHESFSLRAALAKNPNLSFSSLMYLADDKELIVREVLLRRGGKQLPRPVIKTIAARNAEEEIVELQRDIRELSRYASSAMKEAARMVAKRKSCDKEFEI